MKTHKISIPAVTRVGTKKTSRHTNKQTALGHVLVELEIAEFEADEAPLAAEYRRSYTPDDKMQVRFHEGKFYEACHHEGESSQEQLYTTAEYFLHTALNVEQAPGQPFYHGPSGSNLSEYLRGQAPHFEDAFHWYDKDAVAKFIEPIRKIASETIFVDGFVWRLVDEPVYQIQLPYFHEGERFASYISVESSAKSTDAKSRQFSLSAFEDACDTLRDLYRDNVEATDAATVFLPDVFKFDATYDVVLTELQSAVNAQYNSIGAADISTLIAWGHFRDAVNRATQSLDADDISSALNDFGGAYRDSPGANGRAIVSLDKAAKRWALRPINVNTAPSISIG